MGTLQEDLSTFRSKMGPRPEARNKPEDNKRSCRQKALFLFLALVDGQRVRRDGLKRDAPLSKSY